MKTYISRGDIRKGTGSPIGSATPSYVGEVYVTNTNVYVATGTANNNWVDISEKLNVADFVKKTELTSTQTTLQNSINTVNSNITTLKNDLNTFKAKDFIYHSNNIQEHRITQNNGTVLVINPNTDLNTIKNTGLYNGHTLVNSPKNAASYWWYVTVLKHNDLYCLQTATTLNDSSGIITYQRELLNNTWGAWERINRKITISTSNPSGGKDGDIWFKYT